MTLGAPLPSLSRIGDASHFDAASRSRGQTYFVQGHVTITDASKDHAYAVVRGTRPYRVAMTVTDRELVVRCDCALEWNPAVSAQAVDRAHRLGQSRPVFAYRVIAKGTVEEKVAELQKTKSAMAQAILSAGEEPQGPGSTFGDLSIDELANLLS